MDKTKALGQFHYFNIDSDVDSVYGNWAVSKDGDVVNMLYPYAIFSFRLDDCDWLIKMKDKVWFKEECEQYLDKAIERAKYLVKSK